LPPETAVPNFRSVHVSEAQCKRFRNGAALSIDRVRGLKQADDGEIFKVFFEDMFLGLAEYSDETREINTKCVIIE
jgi:hypothetical protein